MALGYLAADLQLLEERVQRLERRAQRRLLRTTENPFDLTNNEFKELYRLTPDLIFYLMDALEPRFQRTRITGLSAEKQVRKSLYFCFIMTIMFIVFKFLSLLFLSLWY